MAINYNWQTALSVLEPLFLAPLVSGLQAEDEAKKREQALGGPPTYEIPASYDEGLRQLQQRQQQQMPGYDAALVGIQEGAAADATGAQQLMSGPEAIMAQSDIYSNQMAQIQDLGMRASAWQQEQQARYAQALSGRAGLEAQQFEYNQWLPWQIEKNEIASLRGAGQQMMVSGLDTAGAGTTAMIGNILNQTQQ